MIYGKGGKYIYVLIPDFETISYLFPILSSRPHCVRTSFTTLPVAQTESIRYVSAGNKHTLARSVPRIHSMIVCTRKKRLYHLPSCHAKNLCIANDIKCQVNNIYSYKASPRRSDFFTLKNVSNEATAYSIA